MKTSLGSGQCERSGEKGAHEQAMMRSWMTRGRREMVLDAVMVLGVFEGDATLPEVGAEEPTEVTMNEVGDRQACVSDGCGARRMQLGRW